MSLPDWLIHVLNFIVVPVLGWQWKIHSTQSKQATDIAVLQTKIDAHGEKYDRIMDKLDDIEAALRRKD